MNMKLVADGVRFEDNGYWANCIIRSPQELKNLLQYKLIDNLDYIEALDLLKTKEKQKCLNDR